MFLPYHILYHIGKAIHEFGSWLMRVAIQKDGNREYWKRTGKNIYRIHKALDKVRRGR